MARNEHDANIALASDPQALERARWRAVLCDGGKAYTRKPSTQQKPAKPSRAAWVQAAATMIMFAGVGVMIAIGL